MAVGHSCQAPCSASAGRAGHGAADVNRAAVQGETGRAQWRHLMLRSPGSRSLSQRRLNSPGQPRLPPKYLGGKVPGSRYACLCGDDDGDGPPTADNFPRLVVRHRLPSSGQTSNPDEILKRLFCCTPTLALHLFSWRLRADAARHRPKFGSSPGCAAAASTVRSISASPMALPSWA